MEAIAIAFVSRVLLNKKALDMETLLLAVVITVTHIVLDLFAPDIGAAARQGSGFRIGHQQVGGSSTGLQAALGTQRALRRRAQKGGAGSITAVAIIPPQLESRAPAAQIPTLNEENCQSEFLPAEEAIEEAPAQQVNTLERFMDDRMALDYYNRDRLTSASGPVEGMDDKMALHYYETDRHTAPHVHEAFVSDITRHRVRGVEAFVDTEANQATYANYKSGLGPTAGEKGLVYGTVTATEAGKHATRTGQALYSEDLVTLGSVTGHKLVLLDNSKFIRAVNQDEAGLNDKLFKLRFKLTRHQYDGSLKPIRYGAPVSILFNDEQAQTVAINHDGDLNVLPNTRDIVFELINKDKPTTKAVINTDDAILIRRSVEGTAGQYLRINTDRKRVETTAKEEEASVFKIRPQKGCGPLWRHDSDTRGSNVFNPSQVRDILVARTQRLTDRIAELQGSIGKSQEAKQ